MNDATADGLYDPTMSSPHESVGTCEHCGAQFNYWLSHSGFGENAYAYCDSCGKTAILSHWNKKMPRLPDCPGQQEICAAMEPYLQPCSCGGRFRRGAAPRCPHCNQKLSAERASAYIEENAPGAKKGWRWQRNWSGIYSISIEDRRVRDNFL